MAVELTENLPTKNEKRLVCGFPKTGRTWLRFMLANALSVEYGLGVDIDLNNVYSLVPNEQSGTLPGQPSFDFEDVIPKIEMSHSKYRKEYETDRLVFMTRDPRDIIVSHWLHDTLQVKIYDGTLGDYVRSPNRGIGAYLDHLESWAPNISNEQVITYEGMRKYPRATVSDVFGQLGIEVSGQSVDTAVGLGDIRRMRNLELKTGIAGHDYDRSNPEARRVRAGRIGGYINYLTQDDLAYIDYAVSRSSPEAARIIHLTPYTTTQE